MPINHPWMLHVEYWHQLMPLYFCQINIISRHKDSSINRPSKRYATLIFFYTPPHNKWGRMWLNCKVNWHLIVLQSISCYMAGILKWCLITTYIPTGGLYQLSISNHTVPSCVNFIDFFPILLLERGLMYNLSWKRSSIFYKSDKYWTAHLVGGHQLEIQNEENI